MDSLTDEVRERQGQFCRQTSFKLTSRQHVRMPFKLLALVLPLSLDTFAVSAALGVAGLSRRERWRLSLLMAGFEAAMPLVGFLAGGLVGEALGDVADYVAAAVLVGAGLLMLRKDDSGEGLAQRMRGLAALSVGVSVSLDELAIGLAIGLLRLPILAVALLIGAQALVASQLGFRLGAWLGEGIRERTEQFAGGVLVALGLGLALLRLTGHQV
jgi:putative Mn2+ efflux pump MntP